MIATTGSRPENSGIQKWKTAAIVATAWVVFSKGEVFILLRPGNENIRTDDQQLCGFYFHQNYIEITLSSVGFEYYDRLITTTIE